MPKTKQAKPRKPREVKYQGARFLRDMSIVTSAEQRKIDQERSKGNDHQGKRQG